jgi:hypothetical protein
MQRVYAVFAVSIALTIVVAGCGSRPTASYPTANGRRVQSVAVVAAGSVPYQVGAYELVFAEQAGVAHARRAALVVDLIGAQGSVRGFAEWGRPDGPPETYAVGGWATQRAVDGQVLTVFDLALNGLGLESGQGRRATPDAGDRAPVDVRVVVNEGSGEATLTRRR